MGKRRTVHNSAFKAKVAMAALKEVETASQLASKYGVHPVTIFHWKKQLLEGAERLFDDGTDKGQSAEEQRKEMSELYEQIGRLKMELEWLKKRGVSR